ncbi:DUF547 domain-containing protein [Natrinema salaciae]|uniref:DUF547 domain-containing protein n=1 Tax=Natrinema salaciae TaxID=1186196 RepID=A0A1H9P2E7_9EURY|nr:DUF547 domain-containing protein [Natrinema salaciae]SER42085.1 Protein of unknown function, DUF547 [Natrinema salaciae]
MVDSSKPDANEDSGSPTPSREGPTETEHGGSPSAELLPTTTARRLLECVRDEEPPDPFLHRIAEASTDDLARVRTDRRAGLAFWLNVFNAATQLLLEHRPTLFESRVRFFRTRAVTVAGTELSLDDIEHGVLRDRRSKYGLGYLPRLERTGLDGSYQLEVDPRIHFALNCGAASCPAVLAYDPKTVDETLDIATRSYLDQTVEYDSDSNRVRVPRTCLWFIGDFGGRAGLRQLLREFDQIPPNSSPSLRFADYDWTKTPRKFDS